MVEFEGSNYEVVCDNMTVFEYGEAMGHKSATETLDNVQELFKVVTGDKGEQISASDQKRIFTFCYHCLSQDSNFTQKYTLREFMNKVIFNPNKVGEVLEESIKQLLEYLPKQLPGEPVDEKKE